MTGRVRPLLPRDRHRLAEVLDFLPADERGFYAKRFDGELSLAPDAALRGRHYLAERDGSVVGYGGLVVDGAEAPGVIWLSLLLGDVAGADPELSRLMLTQLVRTARSMHTRLLLGDDGCVVSRDARALLGGFGFREVGCIGGYFRPGVDQRFYLWPRSLVPGAEVSHPLLAGEPLPAASTPTPGRARRGLHVVTALGAADLEPAVALVTEFSRTDGFHARAQLTELLRSAPPDPRDASVLVARDLAGRLVGLAGYARNQLRPCHGLYWNNWFYVAAETRGSGLAQALMDQVVNDCRAVGGRKLLATPSAGPAYARARGFYYRYGFRPELELPDYYEPGGSMLILGLDLAPSGVG